MHCYAFLNCEVILYIGTWILDSELLTCFSFMLQYFTAT